MHVGVGGGRWEVGGGRWEVGGGRWGGEWGVGVGVGGGRTLHLRQFHPPDDTFQLLYFLQFPP